MQQAHVSKISVLVSFPRAIMLPRSNLQTRQSVQMRHQTSVWWVTSIVFNVSVRSDAKWHLVGRPIPSIPVSFSPLTLCHIVCICVCLHCGIVWLVVWHRPIIIFHSDHCHRVPSSPRLPLLDGWLCQRHVYTVAQSFWLTSRRWIQSEMSQQL